MGSEPRAEVVITAEGLDDSWRKEILRKLCKFEAAVWSKRAVNVRAILLRFKLE
jgi:hypothetical protein